MLSIRALSRASVHRAVNRSSSTSLASSSSSSSFFSSSNFTSRRLARSFHSSRPSLFNTAPAAATPAAAAAAAAAKPSPPPPPPPAAGFVRVNVDGNDIDVPAGVTVMAACEQAGVDIPRFCYHERLSIAGNCRMCLVEIEKSPKPVASCAMPVMAGQKIKTTTPLVKKAREGVMEFLLNNHPLDCPICDQGGECDLQEQSMDFGSDRSRFREIKRTVEDKYLGPLVKTVMTRCIHCTRCIRYSTEVCGVTVLGATGRGQQMEIGTYVNKLLDSEISGNIVDLCPVGALTSKPYAFKARPWELKHTESIDVHDAIGTNIRVDTRGPEVMRILPRLNEDVNEEWLADKSRYSYDGLKRQRLDTPLVRKNNEFIAVTWPEALTTISTQLKQLRGSEVMAVAGEMVDAEALTAAKDLFNRLGSPNLTTSNTHHHAVLTPDVRSNYLFNSTIRGIEDADVCVVIGANPRMEAAVLNARIRKAVRHFNQDLHIIGPQIDLLTKHTYHGNDAALVQQLAEGKSHPLLSRLQKAKKPMIIVGVSALAQTHGAILTLVNRIRAHVPALVSGAWNGINILHTSASRVAALDLGFVPGVNAWSAPAKLVYLVGAEDYDTTLTAPQPFIVYQGHHGDRGASIADVVLPSSAYTEKDATYVNLEGRVQRTTPAVSKLASARDDWAILRALSEVIGVTLPYNSVSQVRKRMAEIAPHLSIIDDVQTPSSIAGADEAAASVVPAPTVKGQFAPLFANYFQTDPISRSSRIMAQCSAELPNARNSYIVQQ